MQLDPAHLAALSAILRLGSFESAASALAVTPSAVPADSTVATEGFNLKEVSDKLDADIVTTFTTDNLRSSEELQQGVYEVRESDPKANLRMLASESKSRAVCQACQAAPNICISNRRFFLEFLQTRLKACRAAP